MNYPFIYSNFYDELYGLLAAADDPTLATRFAGFFSQGEGFYYCTNPAGYESFIAEIFEEDVDSVDYFTTYGGYVEIKSYQGSGTLPTLPN